MSFGAEPEYAEPAGTPPPPSATMGDMPAPDAFTVEGLGGASYELQSTAERDLFVSARDKYASENSFSHASDLRALDRLVLLEVQMYRHLTQMSSGRDAVGDILSPSELATLRRTVKETGPLITAIQADLGLSKTQRERDQHESVGTYLIKLKQAAKAHGVRREKQLGRALELMNDIIAQFSAFERANENERRKLGFENADDLVTWINEVVTPAYNEIDDYFRKNDQRFWVREL